MDLGQDRRGVDMGPSAIRYARVEAALGDLGHRVTDLGNAGVPIPEMVTAGEEVKHLAAVKSVCEEVSERAAAIVSEGLFPVFLGGDHSIAIGTVSGIARSTPEARTGLIWVDAHADFNTPETSPSGNIHGMPLATLTGRGHPDLVGIGGPGASVRTEDVVIIGLRSVDVEEKRHQRPDGRRQGAPFARPRRGRPRSRPRRRHTRARRAHLQGGAPPDGARQRGRNSLFARCGRSQPYPGCQERHSHARCRASREPNGTQNHRPAARALKVGPFAKHPCFHRFQNAGERSATTVKISSLPRSIQTVSTKRPRGLTISKLSVAPTCPRPGPTSFRVVATAVAEESGVNSSWRATRKVAIPKTPIQAAKSPRTAVRTVSGTTRPPS